MCLSLSNAFRPHSAPYRRLARPEATGTHTNAGKNDASAAHADAHMSFPGTLGGAAARRCTDPRPNPAAGRVRAHRNDSGCASGGAYVHAVRAACSASYATERSSTCPPNLGAGSTYGDCWHATGLHTAASTLQPLRAPLRRGCNPRDLQISCLRMPK